MPSYVTLAEVKKRLFGKVQWTTDETDENKMQESFGETLIGEAEAEIEMRLSNRYEVPFVTTEDGAFSELPDTTKNQLKAIILAESCKRILMMDFGRGSHTSGEEYLKSLTTDVDNRIDRLVEIRKDQFGHWRYPPLPGLKLAAHNEAADDGYAGRVLTTSDGYGSYPKLQINEPSETVFSTNPNLLDDLL